MAWYQLHCNCHAEQIPELEALHQQLGALAITLRDQVDDAIFEPEVGTTPVWEHTKLTALYPANQAPEDIMDQLIATAPDNLVLEYQIEWLDDKPWEREWLKHFKPIQIAPELLILPSHESTTKNQATESNQTQAAVMRLDPGLAFGTGTHATTQLCLKWLCRIMNGNTEPLTVLDYGCGSGILAIGAALLGATQISAIDIDPQALLATQANAEKNQVTNQITVNNGDVLDSQYDIIVANILAAPLCHLAPKLMQHLVPDGQIALSGLLESQIDDVIEAYSPYCRLEVAEIQDEWVLLTRQKR